MVFSKAIFCVSPKEREKQVRRLVVLMFLATVAAACGAPSPSRQPRFGSRSLSSQAEKAQAQSLEPQFGPPPSDIGATRLYPGPCVEEAHLWRVGNLVSRTTTVYDDKERPVRVDLDKIVDGVRGLDGEPEISWLFTYDRRGRLTLEEKQNLDSETAAWWNTRTKNTYDGSGRIKTKAHDRQINGTVDYLTTFTYKKGGSVVIEETRSKADKSLMSRTTRTNDKDGRPLRQEEDIDADGRPDSVWIFTYDENGHAITEENDRNADGRVDTITRKIYGSDSRLKQEETDLNSDGDADLTTLYTYDGFGNLVSTTTDQVRSLYLYGCWD